MLAPIIGLPDIAASAFCRVFGGGSTLWLSDAA
jgi:hypothetical protein